VREINEFLRVAGHENGRPSEVPGIRTGRDVTCLKGGGHLFVRDETCESAITNGL
jgi:hypothetical protein